MLFGVRFGTEATDFWKQYQRAEPPILDAPKSKRRRMRQPDRPDTPFTKPLGICGSRPHSLLHNESDRIVGGMTALLSASAMTAYSIRICFTMTFGE
jgi:hypothetical protein